MRAHTSLACSVWTSSWQSSQVVDSEALATIINQHHEWTDLVSAGCLTAIKFCHSDRAMAELAAVLAALAGKGGTPTKAAASPRPLSPTAGRPGWFVPPHLLRLPAVRAAVPAVQRRND